MINALDEFGVLGKKSETLDLESLDFSKVEKDRKAEFLKELKKQMKKQANLLEFEKAALIRDRIKELEEE